MGAHVQARLGVVSRSPVIVIGMHRSGTSMLTSFLGEAGMFIGWRFTSDLSEARYFQQLNQWILNQASARWTQPGGVDDMLADERSMEAFTDFLAGYSSGPRSYEFLGPSRYARYRSILRMDEPWGWKDPRNSFTLPLWARIFPEARIVHVIRHGVDAAQSLRVRERSYTEVLLGHYWRHRRRYRLKIPDKRFSEGFSVLDIDQGIDLWDKYVTRCREHVADFGDRAFEFRYEDLLSDPDPIMGDLLDFCEMPKAPGASWKDSVDPDRAFAYRADPELVEVAERNAETLARHDY